MGGSSSKKKQSGTARKSSLAMKRKSSLLSGKKNQDKQGKGPGVCLIHLKLDEDDQDLIKMNFELKDGEDPTGNDMIYFVKEGDESKFVDESVFSEYASGERTGESSFNIVDEIRGQRCVVLYVTISEDGETKTLRGSSEPFQVPDKKPEEEEEEEVQAEAEMEEKDEEPPTSEPSPPPVQEEKKKSVIKALRNNISVKWEKEMLQITFSVRHETSTSDYVSVSLNSADADSYITYEYNPTGEQTGMVEISLEKFIESVENPKNDYLECRYYVSEDTSKPFVSSSRFRIPTEIIPKKLRTPGEIPNNLGHDTSKTVSGYSMTVTWDPDQEFLVLKAKPPKGKTLSNDDEFFLVRSDAKKDFHEYPTRMAYGSFYDWEENQDTHFGIPKPDKEYLGLVRVAVVDKQKKLIILSKEFFWPGEDSRESPYPEYNGDVKAEWNQEEQGIIVNFEQYAAKDPNTLMISAYVYDEEERDKNKSLLQEQMNECKDNICRIPPATRLKEGHSYYVRLLRYGHNSANVSLATSNVFKVTGLENETDTLQICDISVVGEPEIEVDNGFENLNVTVSWNFTKKFVGLSMSDQIYVLEYGKPIDPNNWEVLSAYTSGKLSGKVQILVGGHVEKNKAYQFHYVYKKSNTRILGSSKTPFMFSNLPDQSDDANKKAKEASTRANQVSSMQHSMTAALPAVEKYNPLLTIVPEKSMWDKLFEENQNKRKKRRESAILKAEKSTPAIVQSSIQKKGDSVIGPTELLLSVQADFNISGGFIYAGAGVSMAAPASSPSWWLLMNELLREIFNGAPDEHAYLRSKLGSGDATRQPEEIMESFYFVLQDRLLTVFELLEAGEPNANHIAMAKLAKAGKIRGILTTNFDIFIERALKTEGVTFKTVVTAEEFEEYYKTGCKEFAVLKIHGTVDRPSTIVAVANHYKSGKGFSGAKEKVLGHFLRNHPTLFLGYSGWDFEHVNYQSFWAGEGEFGGKNVYWLNLLGAKGGPNLEKVVGTHIGKRLVIGEGSMPGWAADLLESLGDKSGAQQVKDFDAKLDRDAIQKSMVIKRKEFLVGWVKKIPVPQLLTLLQMEAGILNDKVQQRLKRQKEANKESTGGNTDTSAMTRLLTQMAMDMSAGKITMEEYMDQIQLVTLQQTFAYVYVPKVKKDALMKLFLDDSKTNPLFVGNDPDKSLNKSMLPSILSSVVEGMPDSATPEDYYKAALEYIKEKLDANFKKGDKLSLAKRNIYMYQSLYLRADAEARKSCEALIDKFAQKCVDEGWDDSRISTEANSQISKEIQNLAYGTIDMDPILSTELKELLKISDDASFITNAMAVALGVQRSVPYRISSMMGDKDYQTMISTPLYSNSKHELPSSRLEEYEKLMESRYPPERVAVMDRLKKLKAEEVLCTFEISQIEMWVSCLKYAGNNYQEESQRDSKGYYPREALPPFVCNYLLPKLKRCQSIVKDSRVIQPILGLLTIVGESLDDLDTLKYAADSSLKLTGGKVTELTPVGIPECVAYAYQTRNMFVESLSYYLKAMDGIKTSVMRQKTDAIVLQACLVQAQSDKEKALRMAFTYSPHFGSSQQYVMVGAGRSLLVQQCQKWSEDLGLGSLDQAEEKLMKKE